jgi:DNA-binding NtrC family response regulator
MKGITGIKLEMAAAVSTWKELPSYSKMQTILVKEALRRCNNNRTRAAKMLGINRKTVVRILQRQAENACAAEKSGPAGSGKF